VWPDREADKAIDALATRSSDGKTLALEHTLIEPFVGDKEDFSFFERAFLQIEKDGSLVVAGRWTQVFVPVGTLRNHRRQGQLEEIVRTVHEWIRENREVLPEGESRHPCFVKATRQEITLSTEVVPLRGSGKLNIRRQQVADDLSQVVAKALARKLPKLVSTPATRRVLLLERQHMILLPSRILAEIDSLRPKYSALQDVHEIWIVETMAWRSDHCLFFERLDQRQSHQQFGFIDEDYFE
jgi:hypothetical protein